MSRMGHDFSWHVFALVMVVAGLSLLAPLAWWQAHEGRSFGQRTAETLRRRPIAPIADEPVLEPQIAPLRPLVADQIDLDPSVSETPALPVGFPRAPDPQLLGDATGNLRLSSVLSRTQPEILDPKDLEPKDIEP